MRLKVDKGTSHRVSREGADEVILPVLWEDNYPELLPGETGKVIATFRAPEKNLRPTLEVEGWSGQANEIRIQ